MIMLLPHSLNLLLDEMFRVKVADFGWTRTMAATMTGKIGKWNVFSLAKRWKSRNVSVDGSRSHHEQRIYRKG